MGNETNIEVSRFILDRVIGALAEASQFPAELPKTVEWVVADLRRARDDTLPAPPSASMSDGMLPDALVPHAKEWYRLCERRFAVERITISGELAEAIVEAIGAAPQSAQAPGGEAVACYGIRRKGTRGIIGVVPEKIASKPPTSPEYVEHYEEVPLYEHPAALPADGVLSALVNRFLAWKLPDTVRPDGTYPAGDFRTKHGYALSGTNLLSASEARAMFTDCLDGLALTVRDGVPDSWYEAVRIFAENAGSAEDREYWRRELADFDRALAALPAGTQGEEPAEATAAPGGEVKLNDPELQRQLDQGVARYNELPQWMRDAATPPAGAPAEGDAVRAWRYRYFDKKTGIGFWRFSIGEPQPSYEIGDLGFEKRPMFDRPTDAVRALVAKWRAEAAKYRAIANVAQERGDLAGSDESMDRASDIDRRADELAAIAGTLSTGEGANNG